MPGLPRNVKTTDVVRAFNAANAHGQNWVSSTEGREPRVMRWDGRTVPIPDHPRDLPPGTLRSIIRQAGWTVDEFRYLAGFMNRRERQSWLRQHPEWR